MMYSIVKSLHGKAAGVLRAALALCPLLLAAAAMPAASQTTASVTVNAGAPLGTIPSTAFGVNTAVWDGDLLDSAVPGLLDSAGVTMLRYPGGSTSDVYHWQTQSLTAGGYLNASDTFDNFMGVATAVGASPIITVNYGSNTAGSGGGDPNEAAAWVAYANNTKKYGIKYWEIGNEIYGNGEYGSAWEEDLHSDHSPTAYGNNVVTYAAAMKAEDPTIKIGAVLASPGDWPDGLSPDWNSGVLAACGADIDFVIVHWYAQEPGSESDSGLLAQPSALAAKVAAVRALIAEYCGSNAPNVQIFVTETNSVSYNPGKQSVSLVNGLFAADDYMTWLENGVANVDWWDLHNGASTGNNNSSSLYGSAAFGDYGLLSSGSGGEPTADTPFAPYYGVQMLTHLGKPGDQMVSSSSSQNGLTVHAVKQAGGNLALLLINKDPSNSDTATVTVSGYMPASASTIYSYGMNSAGITSASGVAGTSFTQIVPPYSLTTVLLSPGAPTVPVWSGQAKVAHAAVAPSAADAITATVKDAGTAYSNANVDIEIHSSAGTKVGQQYYTRQNFAANSTHNYGLNWSGSATPGVYSVYVGVWTANWQTCLYRNGYAATITVSAPDTAEYNFESGTQGWATTGGIVTGVGGSTVQAFAGTSALAVQFGGSGSGQSQVSVASPATPAGKTVTFHVWIPAGSGITAIQPYVQQGSGGGWLWTGNYQSITGLKTGAWNTLTVTVPMNAVIPLYQLGVQFFTGAAWSGSCYVDSVSW